MADVHMGAGLQVLVSARERSHVPHDLGELVSPAPHRVGPVAQLPVLSIADLEPVGGLALDPEDEPSVGIAQSARTVAAAHGGKAFDGLQRVSTQVVPGRRIVHAQQHEHRRREVVVVGPVRVLAERQAGRVEEERDLRRLGREGAAVLEEAVLPEVLAMVPRDGDDRAVAEPGSLQRAPDRPTTEST
jgi:hypothetical protein